MFQALNARILQAAEKDEVIDANEVPVLTNHMLVQLTIKSCHRVEIWSEMTVNEFLQGMRDPQCFFPYVPVSEEERSASSIVIDDKHAYKFDR